MRIRRATAEDCPAMLELIKELAAFEKAPNEVTVDPVHFEQSGFGPNPVWWAWVVERVEEVEGVERVQSVEINQSVKVEEKDETNQPPSTFSTFSTSSTSSTFSTLSTPSTLSIIAFALYYIRYSTWKGQVMYLEDIIVTEKMRGKGIGTMLMDRVIEEAREKGFKRIAWQVLNWNAPAIAFYKKYGATFDDEWVNVTLET